MNKSEIKHLILVSTMVLLQFVVCFDYPFNISISFTVKAIIAIVIPTVLILSLVFSLRQKSKIMSKYTESKITRMGSHRWDYWKVGERKTNGVEGYEIHWSDDGECITDHVYTEEDANLIAASPLMLETLKYLQAVGGLGLKNHEYIKKAIDVAEGRL